MRISSCFKALWINLKEIMLAATAFLTLQQAKALCLFFKVLLQVVVLITTLWLSPYVMVGPLIATPSILSWYLSSVLNSVAIVAATNSNPQVELSTVFCLLLYQRMCMLLTSNKTPEADLLVSVKDAQSALVTI